MVDRNECSDVERVEILQQLPQKPPFRFIDEILELSSSHIVASYHFSGSETFYEGHFPGDPVTPGVILVEAMAQAGLVALGLLLLRNEKMGTTVRTLFSECSIEFLNVVRPKNRVFITGEKIYWRRRKLQSKVELRLESGELCAAGTVSGLGVAIL